MVLLLSTDGELLELHFCQYSAPTFDGLGRLCSAVSLLLDLFDFELHRPSPSLSLIVLGGCLISRRNRNTLE